MQREKINVKEQTKNNHKPGNRYSGRNDCMRRKRRIRWLCPTIDRAGRAGFGSRYQRRFRTRGGRMLSEVKNLDGDTTYTFLEYFKLGRELAKKAYGEDV